jgi:hypothetical protein
MENAWKPLVAGILEIVSGAVGLVAALGLSIAVSVTGGFFITGTENVPMFVPSFLMFLTVILILSATLTLAGGIYALQRKSWGLALAGAISAVFCSIPLLGGLPVGITAVILIALSKKEFA